MTEGFLPKNTRILWQIRTILVFLFLILILRLIFGFGLIFEITFIVLSVICLFLVCFWFPLFFKYYKISVSDTAICLQYGLIIKTQQIMPFPRMIYGTSIVTPLARKFGLSMTVLKAARSLLIIPELPDYEVEQLLNVLSEKKI